MGCNDPVSGNPVDPFYCYPPYLLQILKEGGIRVLFFPDGDHDISRLYSAKDGCNTTGHSPWLVCYFCHTSFPIKKSITKVHDLFLYSYRDCSDQRNGYLL